jgi:hypothetical protein
MLIIYATMELVILATVVIHAIMVAILVRDFLIVYKVMFRL